MSCIFYFDFWCCLKEFLSLSNRGKWCGAKLLWIWMTDVQAAWFEFLPKMFLLREHFAVVQHCHGEEYIVPVKRLGIFCELSLSFMTPIRVCISLFDPKGWRESPSRLIFSPFHCQWDGVFVSECLFFIIYYLLTLYIVWIKYMWQGVVSLSVFRLKERVPIFVPVWQSLPLEPCWCLVHGLFLTPVAHQHSYSISGDFCPFEFFGRAKTNFYPPQ
jgi:hypothetical protein